MSHKNKFFFLLQQTRGPISPPQANNNIDMTTVVVVNS